jgi:hypothetical protein
MEDLLIYFAVLIGLGVVAHYMGMIVLNALLENSKTPNEFFSRLLKQTYILTMLVFAIWLVFGEASVLFTSFTAALFITFLRLDLDSVIEYYEK